MLAYRIANLKYRDKTLSGIGAEKFGGRWNEKGTRAVYCSENVSLALLEYYIHSDNIATLPKEILVAKILVPDEFVIKELDVLPDKWDQYPYSSKTAKVFTDLTKKNDFFALKVPSAVVGIESNFVLNPLYRDFEKVEVIDYLKLPINPRLKESHHK